MPPHRVIRSLASLLGAPPAPVLPAARVAGVRPALAGDLPLVSVGMDLAGDRTVSPSRFKRDGDQIVLHTSRVRVQSGANGFTADLRALNLSPVPVRHRPPTELPGADVTVANITGAATVAYTLATAPAASSEFGLDIARGRVVFGAPQQVGDELEVTHWTVSWREPMRWERLQGTLLLELWAASATEGSGLAERMQDRLAAEPLPRSFGFLRLAPQRVEAAESVQHATALGAAFPVWRQRLEYAFAHEHSDGGETSDGAPIRRIDVTIDDTTPDHLTIGA